MRIFPTKLSNVKTSIFTIMSQMAYENNAVNLSQGFPDFESDPILIDLVARAMKDGYNQYAPMAGDFELRNQISLKFESIYNKVYHPETEITITAGATQAIFTTIAATIGKGDEVIIFTPAYDCYEPTITLFGGLTISIQLEAPSFRPNWEMVSEAINVNTKMIIINSPHNPTGMVFSEGDMLHLQSLVEQHELIVISDEVYEHIIFDGNSHQSAAKFSGLASRTFIIGSFGKTFHNTGWKVGYCVSPEYLMKEFRKVHQFNVFSVNHPVQRALAIYLRNRENYLNISAFYQKKRDFFISLLKDSRFKIVPSKGTYFQLLDFSNISSQRDVVFSEQLTKENKIATIPTSVFNANNEDYKLIRVCFAKRDDTLRAAATILKGI